MLSDEQLAAIVEIGVESRSLEFKRSGSSSDQKFVAVVARACIALANQRDGGHLIIGIEDADPGGAAGGLEESILAEWLKHDLVVEKINRYADPPIRIQCKAGRLPSGRSVAVIEVAEFDTIPILSARAFQGKIEPGLLYTRSMAKPESSARNTQNELRELLELATQKSLRGFLETMRGAGVSVGQEGPLEDVYLIEQDRIRGGSMFTQVSEGARMFFHAQPVGLAKTRVNYDGLIDLARESAIGSYGTSFPAIKHPKPGASWIEELNYSSDEHWFLSVLAQFGITQLLPEGYPRDFDGLGDPTNSGPFLPVWFVVTFVARSISFAARVQSRVAPGVGFHVSVSMVDAAGWTLVAANNRRSGFHSDYTLLGDCEVASELPPQPSTGDTRRITMELCREVLLRFGWGGVSLELVEGILAEAGL